MLSLNRQEKTGCYFYGKEGSRVTIGDKIKALRTERRMSQDAVASALSVTRQSVAKWESNQSVPSTTNTIKLAELFQVQFQDLLSQEEIPSAEIQRYIVKVAQAEEKKKEKQDVIKFVVVSAMKISACYLMLFMLCWSIFHLLGVADYIWSWTISHYILQISFLYSLIGCLLYREKLGYYTFAGTVVGLILGNIVGSITTKSTVLHFNNGWIALLICIGIFSLCGIVVSFVKIETSKEINPLACSKKTRRIVFGILSFCMILFFALGISASSHRLAFQRGASAGYNAGFEQGLADKGNGLPSDSSMKSANTPDSYQFGTSAYSGYMIYWPTGYQDGYNERR